jgi:Domain of unknown function (DUF4386)
MKLFRLTRRILSQTPAPRLQKGVKMNLARNPGRVAGLWYLLLVVIGPIRLMYIPNKLFVHGDAASTFSNIAAHERLFRFGVAGDLVCALILIFLTLAFYRLFREVDWHLAVLVVILGGVMPGVIDIVNVVTDLGVLTFVSGTNFLSAFDRPQRDALTMLLLRLHDHQNTAAEILWGAWLFPLGLVAYRSRFLPRFLGVWLIINGFAYLALSFSGVLLPQFQSKVFLFAQPALFGEIALMLWLVIKGAKPPRVPGQTGSLSAV